jgi:hypothetical protein
MDCDSLQWLWRLDTRVGDSQSYIMHNCVHAERDIHLYHAHINRTWLMYAFRRQRVFHFVNGLRIVTLLT